MLNPHKNSTFLGTWISSRRRHGILPGFPYEPGCHQGLFTQITGITAIPKHRIVLNPFQYTIGAPNASKMYVYDLYDV